MYLWSDVPEADTPLEFRKVRIHASMDLPPMGISLIPIRKVGLLAAVAAHIRLKYDQAIEVNLVMQAPRRQPVDEAGTHFAWIQSQWVIPLIRHDDEQGRGRVPLPFLQPVYLRSFFRSTIGAAKELVAQVREARRGSVRQVFEQVELTLGVGRDLGICDVGIT
jgi:hypothetical protein